MFEIQPSTLIMMMLMVIIIILLVVVVVKTYDTKEKFGNLEVRRIISKSSLRSDSVDETPEDLEDVDESLNQKPEQLKEGYVVGRSNMICDNKFDYLLQGRQDKPSFRQSDKSIVQEIGDSVKEKVQAMTEQIAESNTYEDSTVAEMKNPDPEIAEAVPEEEKTYETEAAEGDVQVLAKNDVVSNSGKGIEVSGSESFGLTRLNNDFSLFKTDAKASEIAQSEDPANNQKSIDMINYIKKIMPAN